MGVLNEKWNDNDNYHRSKMTKECIVRCWRKIGILPAMCICNINNGAGSRICRDAKDKLTKEKLMSFVAYFES